MTRDEFAAAIETVHAANKSIQARAMKNCGETDLKYAADQMGILTGGKIQGPSGGPAMARVCDVALFEPNARGVRAFDRFLAGPVRTLPPAEQDVARKMAGAVFTLLKLAEPHETGGLWMEDLLDHNRRLWVIDLPREDEMKSGDVIATRIFDTGLFHTIIGGVLVPSDMMVQICVNARTAGNGGPFPRPLSVTLYGLALLDPKSDHRSAFKFASEIAKVIQDSGLAPAKTA